MIERQLYALFDDPEDPRKDRGAFPVDRESAEKLNVEGYGIFHAVNRFHDTKRVKTNLAYVNSWIVESDTGTKEEQFKKIMAGLLPSLVIESKRGFHIYWDAIDGTAENWQEIVEFRLIPYFGGDLGAKDLCRILRAPGFNHVKNINEPFPIKEVFKSEAKYKAKSMMRFFESHRKQKIKTEIKRHLGADGDSLFEKIYNMNCLEALRRLSGQAVVSGEQYEFRTNHNGKHNIWVNGKSTGCFIDTENRIGATHGPTIWGWLKYFHHSDKEIYKIIKQYFPELWAK